MKREAEIEKALEIEITPEMVKSVIAYIESNDFAIVGDIHTGYSCSADAAESLIRAALSGRISGHIPPTH